MLLRLVLCVCLAQSVLIQGLQLIEDETSNDAEVTEDVNQQPPASNLVAARPRNSGDQNLVYSTSRPLPTTPTTTTPPATKTSVWSSEEIPGTSSGRLLGYLQRISERLASLEALQLENTRRLEGIDYRVTRIEVQAKEKFDSLIQNVQESSRRSVTTENELGRIDSVLDTVRDETAAIRSAQIELKAILTNFQLSSSPARATATQEETPTSTRIQQTILAGVNNIRSIANNLKDQVSGISKNLTLLANTTKEIEKATTSQATKQDLHKGFVSLRQETSRPVHQMALTPFCSPPTSTPEKTKLPKDCDEAMQMGVKRSGIQRILPESASAPFFVYCDMETRDGGWTVIHNRFDGSVNFLREWSDYKHGFGNLATEFWLGLEKIHMITSQGVYELLIELTDFGLNPATAHYNAFAIGSEIEGYDLRLVGLYEGDAGDSLSYHSSMKFSTIDIDQDLWPEGNCARDHTGGWWYRTCDTSNLNGQYLTGNVPASFEYKGMYWYDFNGPQYSLMKARMMIRPSGNTASQSRRPTTGTTAAPRREDRMKDAKLKKKKDSDN